jgi:hypothetical protein
MARGSNSRDGRSARSETINRAFGSPLVRDSSGVFTDAEGNKYTDGRAYGMLTKDDLKAVQAEMTKPFDQEGGRTAKSEQPPSYRQRVSNAFFDVTAVTTGFKFANKSDVGSIASKMDKGLSSLDDDTRAKVFETFKANGQTGYYLDKETVDYAKKEAGRVWDDTLSKKFAYLKAEFPEEFKEFTKDWAFSKTSTTPTVEAKGKDIFQDAITRRVSALVNGAKGGEDGELAIKNYERGQRYAPYEYKAGSLNATDFSKAVTKAMNESVQIARDAILSRLVLFAGKQG